MSLFSQLTGQDAAKNQERANSDARRQQEQQLAILQSQYDSTKGLSALIPELQDLVSGPAYAGLKDPWGEEDYVQPGVNRYIEDANGDLDRALAQIGHHPGLRESSGANAQAQMAAQQMAGDVSGYRRDLRVKGGEARYGEAKAAEDARIQRLMATIPMFYNSTQMLANGIGGAANNSQAMANAYGQQSQGALGGLANLTTGIIGLTSKNRGSQGGNNRTGTNQNGGNPYDVPNPNTTWTMGQPQTWTPPGMYTTSTGNTMDLYEAGPAGYGLRGGESGSSILW